MGQSMILYGLCSKTAVSAGLGEIKTSAQKEISLSIEILLDVNGVCGTLAESRNGSWLRGGDSYA